MSVVRWLPAQPVKWMYCSLPIECDLAINI